MTFINGCIFNPLIGTYCFLPRTIQTLEAASEIKRNGRFRAEPIIKHLTHKWHEHHRELSHPKDEKAQYPQNARERQRAVKRDCGYLASNGFLRGILTASLRYGFTHS